MGKVTILPETTKNPIQKIGARAGFCWGGDVEDAKKNYKRGLDCIEANHGRALEFPDVEMALEGYSARVIREWYTHIGCLPSRLQESTRYVEYKDFKYVTPKSVLGNTDALNIYINMMSCISEAITTLEEMGIPREDCAMGLPLGMETRIVDKRNLRNLIDMSRQRKCKRANWEFRDMFDDICEALRAYSEEWQYIVDTQMQPKCEVLGYCPEKYSCGRNPKRKEVDMHGEQD